MASRQNFSDYLKSKLLPVEESVKKFSDIEHDLFFDIRERDYDGAKYVLGASFQCRSIYDSSSSFLGFAPIHRFRTVEEPAKEAIMYIFIPDEPKGSFIERWIDGIRCYAISPDSAKQMDLGSRKYILNCREEEIDKLYPRVWVRGK